jgi:hypothetical protein
MPAPSGVPDTVFAIQISSANVGTSCYSCLDVEGAPPVSARPDQNAFAIYIRFFVQSRPQQPSAEQELPTQRRHVALLQTVAVVWLNHFGVRDAFAKEHLPNSVTFVQGKILEPQQVLGLVLHPQLLLLFPPRHGVKHFVD